MILPIKSCILKSILGIAVFVIAGCRSFSQDKIVPAFPGADGAGMYTTGGRGGIVTEVTNLDDNGPGSLREAIDKKGTRTIVFRISGTIDLESPLVIENGNLTIAGQTAPGDGICLKNYPLTFEDGNVIIRYIRFRLGDHAGKGFDAINCKNQKNVIIDHCSMSWSVDETGTFYDNENFTLQWCIISESLNNSVHKKGTHGYGGIWGGMNASFHHNLLAHHISRNPRFQGSRYHKMPDKEITEFSNNLIYNWGGKCSYGGEEGHYNLLANYYKPGPATKKSQKIIFLEPYRPWGSFYLEGNILEGFDKVTQNNREGVEVSPDALDSVVSNTKFMVQPSAKTELADVACLAVLKSAGASKSRDSVDKRIIEEVRSGISQYGQNGIINSQDEVGGWPVLQTANPPDDSDHDGMPDEWEKKMKLDPAHPDDGSLYTLDKDFTNLEVFLNSIIQNN